MNIEKIKKNYPLLYETSTYLQNHAFFFRNTIPKLFDSKYDYEFAERICKNALKASYNSMNDYFLHLNNLIDLSIDFLKFQIILEKSGKYPHSSFKEIEEIYKDKKEEDSGPNYLWGLYFSEIFWKIHCNLTKFFDKEFISKAEDKGSLLEVPIGTGFYLSEFMLKKPKWNGLGIDIASNAIRFSQKICSVNNIADTSFRIEKNDFITQKFTSKFDRIICGEFLEHVEDPLYILKKLNDILNKDGLIFLTVAVYAGGIDHIYLYENPAQVRKHVQKAGFIIEKELVQAVFEKNEKDPEQERIPVNYSALLSKN